MFNKLNKHTVYVIQSMVNIIYNINFKMTIYILEYPLISSLFLVRTLISPPTSPLITFANTATYYR